jgi:adenylate cyclase
MLPRCRAYGAAIIDGMDLRIPGAGRYSKIEREQRWLLGETPRGLTDPVEIRDIYLRDTDLRLRRMESPDGVVRKLGQKVRAQPDSPEIVRMTTIYLAEREYNVLVKLQGAQLVKTRWHWALGDRRFSVDVFGGVLDGLVLAETELEHEEPALSEPDGALADVTYDNRFSGGALAWTTPEEARELVSRRRT